MSSDDNKNKPKAKNTPNREPDEVLDLLQKFYQPELTEMEEFSDFYSNIEKKLTEQNPVSRVTKLGDAIENSLNEREQKLSQYVRRLEQKKVKPKKTTPVKSKFKFSVKKAIASVVVLALVALASIASLKNIQHYDYSKLDGDAVDWQSLNLSEAQQAKMQEINQSWKAFQAHELSIIQERQSKLAAEMTSEKPDFSLMDKCQRDILDHEVAIKREKLNTFLEKRFILNEEQSLKLVKEMISVK